MKKILILLLASILITGCGVKKEEKKITKEIVPTMQDSIGDNAMWCGTFQLIWNDLKDEFIKKNIEIDEEIVKNLNKETFKVEDISDEYYYKKYGFATLDLKKEIIDALKAKFDQESEILDEFSWNGDLIFYTMLYRKFEFENEFERLSNTDFGPYKDIKYFGVKTAGKEEIKNQIRILFYENDQNFAVSLKTKSQDEVILYKNPNGNSFEEIYNNMINKANNYQGRTTLGSKDDFKVPVLSLNYKREYDELENKVFTDYKNEEYYISKAIQTIEFDLDEKGGRLKSEAGMMVKNMAIIDDKPKKLYLNDTFAIFLKEEAKDKPYFAAKITDITKFTK